ncbi:MAG: PAS domain S-box protein, partial [Verrucomicrobia bacterium]|nr:PAS domain S-box protein [Verrucomicrobiota bacterium]
MINCFRDDSFRPLEPHPDSQVASRLPAGSPVAGDAVEGGRRGAPSLDELHEAFRARFAPPSVIVGRDHRVVHLSEGAARYLRLGSGEASWDLVRLIPLALRRRLQRALVRVAQTGHRVEVNGVPLVVGGVRRSVKLRVEPAPDLAPDLFLVVFEEEPAPPGALTALPKDRPEAQLDLVDEYKSSVRELQASNQALQAINEELRAASEEVEAGREELAAINEELSAVNLGLKHKVEELIHLNRDLQSLMAATQIATLFLDPDLRIVRYTPAAVPLFNLISGDVGRPLSALRHPLAYESLGADAKRVLERLVPIECEVPSSEGRWYLTRLLPYRDAIGRVAGVVLTFVDTTERKTAEAALRRAETERRWREEWFGSLIQNASDLITVISADGLLRFQSPSVERVLGYGPEDLSGRSVFELVHPDDVRRVRVAIRWVRSHPATSALIECRFRHRNGTWRVLQAVGRKMPGGGKERRLVVNLRDVTTQKQLEAQLQQAQKMEAVGQLAGGVAHDFNNLLSVIFGHAALLAPALASEQCQARSLAEIREAAERAAALTRQLLAVSRRQVLEPKLIDLNGIVAEAEAMLRRLIGEDVRLVTRLEPQLRPVKVDPGQIAQVLLNLAVNARDAMPRGGILTLETRNVDDVVVGTKVRPGRHVLLSVTDTGCGMTPEVQARAFEPFFTTKGEGKGTGLGLAVVHGILQQSGGYLHLESRPGAGTRFHIYLPAVRGMAPRPSDSEGLFPTPMPVEGGETILLAEDEDAVRRVTTQLLETFGYHILKASTGEEALRVAESHLGKIDLLMTDVVMPGMGGRELADRLRCRDPRIKVLFQSGYTDDAVVRHGVVHAEVAFLQKPFTPQALAEKVRQ